MTAAELREFDAEFRARPRPSQPALRKIRFVWSDGWWMVRIASDQRLPWRLRRDAAREVGRAFTLTGHYIAWKLATWLRI